ncbi:probable E3 ubiquitin-protein ligase MID2 [Haliotis rufescens]|uniref:probable E3 ubiquitin-protein ligase MID2 n=1 Tax=Haliotis rufescens TaxID=6454 RepID=UPI00201F1B3B|nr:probable E3 ubiquitin-protein ligase MID2 [Haliotis rufescens]
MATSQTLRKHFLSCVICTEVFDNPCTLDCNHTFCRKCVVNYTKTRPEVISAKSLLCPFCSKMTKVTDPERPVEEWADDVKPSFVIQGLLDSFGPGSKDRVSCSYCKDDGETTPADVWCSVCDDAFCQKCARVHNRIPATRHHDVTDLFREVKVERKGKVMCKEHKNEHTKFLCKDCKKAVCHTCCTIYHRKCDQVVTIESEIQTMKSVIAKARGELSLKQDEAKTHVEKQQSKVNEETARHKQLESDVQSAGKTLIAKIKLQERKLLAELKEMSDKHIGQLKADIKLGEMSVQMYQQQTELMDRALQSEYDMDVYEMYQGCEAGDVEAVGDADLKEKIRIEMISFRQNSSVLSRAIDNLQLGEIDVLYEDVLDLEATPALRDTISTRVAGDVKTKDSYDVKVMVVNGTDTVVITDRENKCVKSFYTRNNQPCHSRLKLNNHPWGLTRLTHNQVAVAMPHINRIIIVGVNPDLELLSTITTSKTYVGITSLTSSTLAASSQSPPCVDILDMTGNALRSIGPLHNGKNILQHPNYLCTTRTGNILVSDCATKCVVCLTPEGDVVFTYRPTGDTALKSPRGITSTSTGDILVSDHHLHRVIHLTESGQFVGNILTDLKHPQGICKDGRGKVYVLSRGIKVFTFVTK